MGLAIGLLLGAALAPAASAAPSAVTAGETRLLLDGRLDRSLRQEGVAVEPLGAATLRGRRLTMPLASGVFDQGADSAAFAQSGGLRLSAGRRSVALRRLTLDTVKGLQATVAGKRMRLAWLGGTRLDPSGFDARLRVKRLRLTASAAAILNKALGLEDVLRARHSLGSIDGLGEPSEVQIAFGKILIGGPDTAFAKLESLEVQMGIWGAMEPWTAPGERYFGFPVKPTTVTPDASSGILEGDADDGITLEIHAPPPRNMLLRGPRIDLATRELSATVSGLAATDPVTATIATLDYGAATVQVRPRVGVFELTGIRAVANQFIADQLNTRFATPGLFLAGETLGKVTVTLSDG